MNQKGLYVLYVMNINSKSLIAKIKNVILHFKKYRPYAITDDLKIAKLYIECNEDLTMALSMVVNTDIHNRIINKYNKYILKIYSDSDNNIFIIRKIDKRKLGKGVIFYDKT